VEDLHKLSFHCAHLKYFKALLWQFCSLRFKITASVRSAKNEQRMLGLERRAGRGRLEEEEEM
jgi:hypothetical protein